MRCIKRKLLYGCCRNGVKSVWESCDEGVERLGFLISNVLCGNELCLIFKMSMKLCVLLNNFCVMIKKWEQILPRFLGGVTSYRCFLDILVFYFICCDHMW